MHKWTLLTRMNEGTQFSRLLLPLLIFCWLLSSLLLLHTYRTSVEGYKEEAINRSEQHTQALLELQKSLVVAKLQEMQRVLLAIEQVINTTQLTDDQLKKAMLARKAPSPEILALIWLDAEGQTRVFSRPNENPDLSDRRYFTWHQQHHESNRIFLSKPLVSRSNEQLPFVALSKPLHTPEGEFDGVLALAIDLEALASDLRGLVNREGAHATVMAHLDGEIYFRLPWLASAPTQNSPVLAQHQGPVEANHLTRITSPFDQKVRQLAYGRVNGWPLVVFISENLEPTLADIALYREQEAWRWGAAFILASFLFLGLSRVIHQRHKTLVTLIEKEERYRLAKEAAGIGVWDLRVDSGELTWDQQTWQQLGYAVDAFALNDQAWYALVHPEDLPGVMQTTRERIRNNQPFEVEYRALTASGQWQWQQARGQVVDYTHEGRPQRILGTSLTIQKRKDAEQQLQNQAAALQASNEELEQFAYVASHDLRQPLRMIRSYTDLVNKRLEQHLDKDTRLFMHFIRDGAQRMDMMLVSLLEYSRVGRKGEPLAEVDIRQLAEEALNYLSPSIRDSGAAIHFRGHWPEQLLASGNEIVRLFQNLVSNALKYQPADQQPEIEISADEREDTWFFRVRDNGIGISEDQSQRLFKVFQRLHSRDEYEGTGVGLAICRKIVERHGGKIWIESEGNGQGSVFCFTLAKTPA
ncbi:ATP-binding protein [Marinospirillum perlucidum]|uniref:ATP-binding protein n=1 Tax=Marinospirillum perlucidum TaxID=1982602 RepID=UPI000DF4B689|nr:ATP-binding protein [Marinospirillum perlucidum]